MKDREESKKENRRDWIKKDTKSQNQHSKNQLIQSVEESGYNKSVFETKKSEYGGTKSE